MTLLKSLLTKYDLQSLLTTSHSHKKKEVINFMNLIPSEFIVIHEGLSNCTIFAPTLNLWVNFYTKGSNYTKEEDFISLNKLNPSSQTIFFSEGQLEILTTSGVPLSSMVLSHSDYTTLHNVFDFKYRDLANSGVLCPYLGLSDFFYDKQTGNLSIHPSHGLCSVKTLRGNGATPRDIDSRQGLMSSRFKGVLPQCEVYPPSHEYLGADLLLSKELVYA